MDSRLPGGFQQLIPSGRRHKEARLVSIVTYYARLTSPQLAELRAAPEGLSGIHRHPPSGGELLDLDKASGVIAWLLSPCKRAEQVHFAAEMEEMLNGTKADPSTLPSIPALDDLAIAIEGRGPRKDTRLDVGLGPACVFEPEEVKRFARLLGGVDEGVLRRALDFPLMDKLYLPVEYWEEEGEQAFSEYILPMFENLKRFYQAAANAGQYILVWYN
jgi:hypothetical protein